MKSFISGQAMIEYIFVFSAMALLAMQFYKWGGKYMDESVGSLGYVLTQELSVGNCKSECFFRDYFNE